MAFALAVGDILRHNLWFQDTEQAATNTMFWNVFSVGGSPATDQDLVTQLDAIWGPPTLPLLNNNASYRGSVVQRIWPLPVRPAVTAAVNAGVGTGGATALPRQVAGLISYYTNTSGRHGRGRNYIPFPATAHDTGDGVPQGTYTTALLNNYVANFATLNLAAGGRTAVLVPIVYDRATHAPTQVTRFLVRSKWATQRRRGSFGRPNVSPV